MKFGTGTSRWLAWRRTKPGLRLLVDGLPGRVDLWRIGGNAIVPQLAAEVLKAYLETENQN
jgi:DNA (cytosine-5)-methyltransferase 1